MVRYEALRNFLTKVPPFREPRTINFDKNCESNISNVELILEKMEQEGEGRYCVF